MSSVNGQSARLLVEEEPRLGPGLVATLLLPMGAMIVRDKALNLRIARVVSVQVNRCWTFQLMIKTA